MSICIIIKHLVYKHPFCLPSTQGTATLEAALDWLCLNLPQSQLPRRFAGGVRSGTAGARVKVVAKAQQSVSVAVVQPS